MLTNVNLQWLSKELNLNEKDPPTALVFPKIRFQPAIDNYPDSAAKYGIPVQNTHKQGGITDVLEQNISPNKLSKAVTRWVW